MRFGLAPTGGGPALFGAVHDAPLVGLCPILRRCSGAVVSFQFTCDKLQNQREEACFVPACAC